MPVIIKTSLVWSSYKIFQIVYICSRRIEMALIFSADIYQGLDTHKEQEDLKNTCHWEYYFWASQKWGQQTICNKPSFKM